METNGKKQKRRPGDPWLIFPVYILTGMACGIVIMQHLIDAGTSLADALVRFALLFLCMYAAMTLQIVIHEGGHLVFGLATGYRFCSFRIFNLMWVREDGKLRLRRLSIAGTGGQCLMGPPDLNGRQMPVMLYNFGGAIMNVISSIVFGGLALLFPAGSAARTVLLLPAVIGIAFALINGIPDSAGPVNNDGRNALDLARSAEARRAFWIQMKANELVSRGVRTKDMPAEWFEMPSEEGMNNGITAIVGVLACSRLMDEKRFDEAEREMARILEGENAVTGLHRALMTCDRMYIELIGQNRRDVLDAMQTKEQKRLMKAMKQYPTVLRTEYAMALLAEKDAAKAEAVRRRFEKAAKTYPYPSELDAERELMALADEKAA